MRETAEATEGQLAFLERLANGTASAQENAELEAAFARADVITSALTRPSKECEQISAWERMITINTIA